MDFTYCDLHCDTVTAAFGAGFNLDCGGLQSGISALKKAGCAAQCFAVFTEDKTEKDFFAYTDFFFKELVFYKDFALPVLNKGDFSRILRSGRLACVLTAENLGFLNGEADGVLRIAQRGVKVASLVWNTANAFAYPNMVYKNGLPDFAKREQRGLTAAGKNAVEIMNSCGILADVSHLSDGGAADVFKISALPVIASHSNAYGVCPVSRNLTDGQIRAIADSGGIVGVNFCRNFLGFENIFEGVLAHLKHIINIGGEDVSALGSDFDGMPAQHGLENCGKMPDLLNYLEDGLGGRMAEKATHGNFITLFSQYF